MKILVRNGNVVNPGGPSGLMDVLMENDCIVEMGVNLTAEDATIIDAAGKTVLPGLIDMHCHLREPGYEFKETIATGTRAAAAGGFTTVACMPNTRPVTDSEAVVQYIRDKAEREGAVRVLPIAAITKGSEGRELTEMGLLLEAGAVAFSDDGKPVESPRTMELALRYAKNFDALLISHCEDKGLAGKGVMNDGPVAARLGLPGILSTAEELMVAREILLAEELGTKVHIAHVSTRGSVELIRQAKARGVAVSAETCPHYFAATDELVEGYGTATKVNPPLRSETDRLAIIAGLQDGTIDAIATDHAPHHVDDKDVEYLLAAFGISGFETAFALAVTKLVEPGLLTMEEVVHLMALRPAAILGLESPTLQPGARADLIVADLNVAWTVNAAAFLSKGHNTPFDRWTLRGRVTDTVAGGKWVLANGIVVV